MDEGSDAPLPPADEDRLGRTLDAFAARREAAKEAIRRMREAVERSRRLLTETAEEIENSHREPFTKYGARRVTVQGVGRRRGAGAPAREAAMARVR